MLRPILLSLVLLALAVPACAGELKLSTVRLDLSDRQSSVALNVANVGRDKTLVHLRLFAWRQTEGQEELVPTQEILVNPPIAEIEAGAQQLVRVGHRGNIQAAQERGFRLIVEEVPRPGRNQAQAIKTYLRISIPVFVAALQPGKPALQARMGRDAEGRPLVLVSNSGATHARIHNYAVGDQRQNRLTYVLPNGSTILPLAAAMGAAPGIVEITTDAGQQTLPLIAAQ